MFKSFTFLILFSVGFSFFLVSCGDEEELPFLEQIMGEWILDQVDTSCNDGTQTSIDADNNGCVSDDSGDQGCFTFTFKQNGVVSATSSEENIDDGTYTFSEETRTVIMCFTSCFNIVISEDDTFVLESQQALCIQSLRFKK